MNGKGPRGGQHECKLAACGTQIDIARLMCRPHWFMVPKPIRDRIWATWRSGAGVLDPEYREAVRQAVEAVEAKLAPTTGAER